MYQYNNNQYNPYGAFSQRPQASQSNLDWIMVQSVNQVENVAVSPCMKAWVMCQNEPIFALRTADAMGLVTTEYYRFEKVNPSEQQTEFVTDKQLREALDKFRGEINESIISARKSKSNVTAAEHD